MAEYSMFIARRKAMIGSGCLAGAIIFCTQDEESSVGLFMIEI